MSPIRPNFRPDFHELPRRDQPSTMPLSEHLPVDTIHPLTEAAHMRILETIKPVEHMDQTKEHSGEHGKPEGHTAPEQHGGHHGSNHAQHEFEEVFSEYKELAEEEKHHEEQEKKIEQSVEEKAHHEWVHAIEHAHAHGVHDHPHAHHEEHKHPHHHHHEHHDEKDHGGEQHHSDLASLARATDLALAQWLREQETHHNNGTHTREEAARAVHHEIEAIQHAGPTDPQYPQQRSYREERLQELRIREAQIEHPQAADSHHQRAPTERHQAPAQGHQEPAAPQSSPE